MVFADTGGEGEVEETVALRITVDMESSAERLERWRKEIDETKEKMRELAKATGESFQQASKSMKKEIEGMEGLKPEKVKEMQGLVTTAQREIIAEERQAQSERRNIAREQEGQIKQNVRLQQEASQQSQQASRESVRAKQAEIKQQILLRQELERTQQSYLNIGNIMRFVFGGTLAIAAYRVLQNTVRFLKESAKEAKEFAQGMFQLEVGVRALQRAGMDITINDVYQNIRKLRAEFGIFSTKELVQGTASLTTLVRDLGFTSDELFNMQDAVATLAVVNGRSMNEVQRTVALALSSGYTEGLQRLGVSINRVTIAQEAANMGFRGGYNALTEIQRAQATYNLILRKTALFQDDLLVYQETAPGRIDRAKSAWTDLRVEIGENLLPVWGFLAGILADAWLAIESINGLVGVAIDRMGVWGGVLRGLLAPGKAMVAMFQGAFGAIQELIAALSDMQNFNLLDVIERMGDAARGPVEEFLGTDILGDTARTQAQEMEALMEDVSTALGNNAEDLEKIIEDRNEKLVDLERDLQRDLEDIARDGARRREELERKHAERIVDINTKASRDLAEAQRKYEFDLAELKRDEQQRIKDVVDKYRERELRDESKFQEKLRRLREEFLFDLEEAVRARDAVSIRRLQRRFELDKNQLLRQFEQQKKDRDRAYKKELEDVKRQNAEKRREMQIAFQQRIADIERERQFQLQEAEIAHQQELEDLRRKLAEKREDRLRAYRQDIEDLNRALTERLKKIAQAIAQEVEYTIEGAQAVYEALRAYYGPGGYIEELYKYYLEYAKQVPVPSGTQTPPQGTPGFAFGGSMIATAPTTFRAGEIVPEVVTVTPIMNRNTSFSEARSMGAGGMSGMMQVLVSLSPGLQGRIIEDTLNQFDNILAGVERSR